MLGVAERSEKEERDRWKNLTSQTKQEFSHYRQEGRKTGAGPAPKAPAPATAKIIDIFKDTPSFKGLTGFHSHPGTLNIVLVNNICSFFGLSCFS